MWRNTLYFSVANERGTLPRLRTRRHRQEHTPTNIKKGWRCATELSWTLWHTGGSPARTPTVHQCLRGGRPWVARSKSTVRRPTNDNKTQTSLESNVLSQPGADRHLESYILAGAARKHDATTDLQNFKSIGEVSREARFFRTVSFGQIFVTKPSMLFEKLGITTICKEYTSTGDAKGCQPIGSIDDKTAIGPALDAKVTLPCGRYCVEIRINSLQIENTDVCVAISRG